MQISPYTVYAIQSKIVKTMFKDWTQLRYVIYRKEQFDILWSTIVEKKCEGQVNVFLYKKKIDLLLQEYLNFQTEKNVGKICFIDAFFKAFDLFRDLNDSLMQMCEV